MLPARALCAAALLCAAGSLAGAAAAPPLACAQPPALPGAGCASSPADRIYTGDQSSNTVTVIAPFRGVVLGTLALGDARLADALGPQNAKPVNAHGLGFSRDGALIVSTSVTSNTVTVIRTRDNTIVSQTSVGRQAHEAFFAADNCTVWVGTRGTDAIDIVDGLAGGVVAHVVSPGGPSKVLFSPDGATAYANHVRAATVSVIDVARRAVRHTISGLADSFSSDMMLSADGRSLWVAHKMIGKLSVIDLAARAVIAVVDSGLETNHPNFAFVNGTNHAFVTVGALNLTRVYRQPSADAPPVWVADVPSSGVEPHGLWPSGDNTRMFIVNEHSDTVDAIDTATLRVVQTWNVGQEGQALIYVSGAVPDGDGTQNLGTQGLTGKPALNKLVPVASATHPGGGALVTVRPLPGVDMFQVRALSTHFASSLGVCLRRAWVGVPGCLSGVPAK
jgi:YVTN family beta-propeller protein